MQNTTINKWTIVTVIVVLLGGIGAIASLSDRVVLKREYAPNLSQYKDHVKDFKDDRRYIRNQLDDIKKLLQRR